MTETPSRDYSETLNLPTTDFPMRAGLPQKEPEILARWQKLGLYGRLRAAAKGKAKFLLHDGPPYANGHIHIGHALNKTLKDIVTRSMQMLGYDSNYVPGWDCHGLPIEWKIEEENYRSKGRQKPDLADPEAMIAFRQECRAYAEHWIGVQRDEFRRLGIEGDWDTPYLTMNFDSEAVIAEELMKFATSGQLYRGSKPVMWSVVEKTALAEAEIEYHDYQSDMIWVKFPVIEAGGTDEAAAEDLLDASVVIWTTTPWTIPGNRAISYSARIAYGLYEVTQDGLPDENWVQKGDRLILADALAEDVFKNARIGAFRKLRTVTADELGAITCAHPYRELGLGGYAFDVPLLDGEHVTDDAGTGFVHTAPGHGTDDFEIWTAKARELEAHGIDTAIPFTVADDGFYTKDAPGFDGIQVIDHKGEKGKANKANIERLKEAGALIGLGRLKHQYPHSWRSKKPIIFRNTPQWFVYMDRAIEGTNDGSGDTLRARALAAIDATRFVPAGGQRRLRSMIENRPDWVLSRQRAWGVPITVFVNRDTGEVLKDPAVNARIVEAFRAEGADAWFAPGARERFLGDAYRAEEWDKVDDILDVWFDSGSTHAFCLEKRADLMPKRRGLGGEDYVLYLEGSDQHRGWFHSSLLESCGTRRHAPYDAVLTHGFTMAEDGRKMSKSLGNQVFPQDVIKQYGADILRLWVASSDYAEDQRIGPEILKTNVDSYRKLRNTIRWMLGSLAHYRGETVALADMPELERLMLHRLAELDALVREAYWAFDYKKVSHHLFTFMTVELSAFYFDVRKDALYCDPASSVRRKAALHVIDRLFDCLVTWLAPMLPFTMEESWLARHPSEDGSVHLQLFPQVPAAWRDDALAAKWARIRTVRRVVTGALEIERRDKRIGSSLEAHPVVHVTDPELVAALAGIDMADICITSQLTLTDRPAPEGAFALDDTRGVAVVPGLAEGRKCARSWKILPEVGSDPDYPDVTPRDAAALREWDAAHKAA
ncbi:isoleucine--tRNA ligase [Polymorphum gilvum]|uniref:Isoleucine--tRNA ligase n=1 Tax=Polymorphum gilvum (strain LMG 25793 / CGMCC 1.9160 / SL003B-26A1) TaxID=991905 RepID=F2J032_POLGS|nr:isoleucine--tRNA ligase [Polymorphum gilvum]ADZ71867.1 Isoleucyl-tRNA synthetase protein [Polymorphum gilvum SL003B-26A1]